MKDFIYVENYSLHYAAAAWLTDIGLHETRWMLDASWISRSYLMTYSEWIEGFK